MCVNCLSSVDTVAWAAAGATAGAGATYQRLSCTWSEAARRRRTAAREHAGRFLRDGPPVRGPGPSTALCAAVFVVYVALGYTTKLVVLNWIVGPLFLPAVAGALASAGTAMTRTRTRARVRL